MTLRLPVSKRRSNGRTYYSLRYRSPDGGSVTIGPMWTDPAIEPTVLRVLAKIAAEESPEVFGEPPELYVPEPQRSSGRGSTTYRRPRFVCFALAGTRTSTPLPAGSNAHD